MIVTIRNAWGNNLQDIRHLLLAVKLPTESIENHISDFLVAEIEGKVAGAVGLEIYSDIALLRSASVYPAYQNQGIGNRLVDAIFEYAKGKGVKELILLTSTAESYFLKKGFIPIDWKTLTGDILTSAEFTGACPTSAVCMRKNL